MRVSVTPEDMMLTDEDMNLLSEEAEADHAELQAEARCPSSTARLSPEASEVVERQL